MWTTLLLLVTLVNLAQSRKQITACATAPGTPEDRRPNKSVLRVGSFNAEWLFLNKWEKRWSSYGEAEEHLHLIANVIRELNADVLNLVEVESCEVLSALLAAIGDPTFRAYLLPGTDTATGQNVALLTRVDPSESLWRTAGRAIYPVPGSACGYESAGDYGVSKHYFTKIEPQNFGSIFLAAVHFLAFPDRPDRCSQREAQATVIREVLQSEGSSAQNFILFGDFNDYDGVARDAKNSIPISRVVQILKNFDPASPQNELENAALVAAQDKRFTAYYSPSSCLPKSLGSSSIDHVLLSPSLLALASGDPFKTSLYDSPCASSQPFSDHWPVVVHLSLGGTKNTTTTARR